MTMNNIGPRIFSSFKNQARGIFTKLAKNSGNGICDGSARTLYQGKMLQCIDSDVWENLGPQSLSIALLTQRK